MPISIPEALAKMASERRVIPFVGAGFSFCLGLPGWSDLLEEVAEHLRISDTEPRLSYKELEESANGDPLRIAEYLYLRAGSAVGPLRLPITTALQPDGPVVQSAAHVELVNLGAPRVYTTNFDALIETTYRDLGEPVEVVALSRDVATGSTDTTQVVKYHGDLGHDPTLVLTESQYYKRLDFESPMDLKFRSDLLGRSVLFIGYSFSDINIRVIWFKLMQMMRDVPERDRPPSYIVRLEPNPVLEALDESVGLRTVVLDPGGETATDAERSNLLAAFLADLAEAASNERRLPGTDRHLFLSAVHLDRLEEWLKAQEEEEFSRLTVPLIDTLNELPNRRVPPGLEDRAIEVLRAVLNRSSAVMILRYAPLLPRWITQTFGPQGAVTFFVARGLLDEGVRSELTDTSVDWQAIWSVQLTDEQAQVILRRADREISFHEAEPLNDDDLAFAADLLKRIEAGFARDGEAIEAAQSLLGRVAALYPAVEAYVPGTGKPDPKEILAEISQRASEDVQAGVEEEAPF